MCACSTGARQVTGLVERSSTRVAPITIFDRPTADALMIRIGNSGSRKGRLTMLGSEWLCQFEYVDMASVRHPELSWSASVGLRNRLRFADAVPGRARN